MLMGTAGHIDHGKTALVKAITGVSADRLPEEKLRGITLDLGYAYTTLPNGRRMGFVDVPGHEKLVHNMLCGMTGLSAVLLVVAADDGIMAQTREHLEIIDLLGISQGAVVITKIDRIDRALLPALESQIRALIAPTSLAQVPIMSVSNHSGEGIEPLIAYLMALATNESIATQPINQSYFRLAIDRSFSLSGLGTVVTGTVVCGSIEVASPITLYRSGKPPLTLRAKSLHVHNEKKPQAFAKDRLAVLLGSEIGKDDIHRGDWLISPMLSDLIVSTQMPQSRYHAYVRLPSSVDRNGVPLQLNRPLLAQVHWGAGEASSRILLLSMEDEGAWVELNFYQPIHALWADRFILRSGNRTLAGGRIIDSYPPLRHKRTPEHLAKLRAYQEVLENSNFLTGLNFHPEGLNVHRLAVQFNVQVAALQKAIAPLSHLTLIADQPPLVFTTESWQALQEQCLAILIREHAQSPEMIGITREKLHRLLSPNLSTKALSRLIDTLKARGEILQSQHFLHHHRHQWQLSASDHEDWAKFLPYLQKNPFNPPRVRDLAQDCGEDEQRIRQLFRRLAQGGRLYPIAQDHYFTPEAVQKLLQIAESIHRQEGEVRAATFRSAIYPDGGGGRKVAIQILEFFDKIGYTRRVRGLGRDTHLWRASDSFLETNLP